ncbi:C type lectin domain protein [Finch poxvirus]|uniref:C type lectin domain protein n=1 Tax=Condorpox virus TaxID=3049970 RepID=A0AAT9UQ66_9POXV|nr:C type lectin domain protein [Finch poxvirus]UOX38749.1 C type lectin domain protein [Finch poxvirus]UOX38897.1 C type lectin domain protein [Finch poxvirus]UOX39084.1 C type lectin domain protein [Finch poxvirus]
MERLGSYEVFDSTSRLFARASSIYKKQKLAVFLAILSVILTIVIIVLLALPSKPVTYCPDDTEIVTIESSPTQSKPICSRVWINYMGYCVKSLGPDIKYTLRDAKSYCSHKDAILVRNIYEHKKFLEDVWTSAMSYWIDSGEQDVCMIGIQDHIPVYPEVRRVSCNERHSLICIKKGTD